MDGARVPPWTAPVHRPEPNDLRINDAATLLLRVGGLGAVLWFARQGGPDCAGAAVELTGTPAPPPLPGRVQAALDAVRHADPARRLDAHFEWIALGSPLATAALEAWLASDFPAGALSADQRERMLDAALAWPDPAVRRAGAAVVLADAAGAGAVPADGAGRAEDALVKAACRAVRGEASVAELAALRTDAAGRLTAALGPAALDTLLPRAVRGDDAGLMLLLRAHPDLRRQAIPRLIEELPVAHSTLVAVADTDLGPLPEPWRSWWDGVERSLRRLAD